MQYFKELALKLAENGYLPIPITPGTKKPAAIDGWVQLASTGENLRSWVAEYPSYGVGISTENCVAVDIDISDSKIAKAITNWCITNIGAAPVRVGRKPRAMLIYRVEKSIYKRVSEAYDDEFETQRIEVLGKGQQFVAYAIHPTTKQPYVWQQHNAELAKFVGSEVVNTELSKLALEDLTVITNDQIDELFDYFNELVAASGHDWELKYERNVGRTVGEYSEDDDIFGFDVQPLNITSRELVNSLEYINPDDRDVWRNVGFGIWHQFSGSDEGFEIWDQWSQGSEKYQARIMQSQWRSFDHSFRKREPITARTILKLAGEAKLEEVEITRTDQVERLRLATERNQVYAVIDELKGVPNVPEAILDAICQAHARVGAGKLNRAEAKRKLVAYAHKSDMPECLENWVYDFTNNVFSNSELGMRLLPEVFNRVIGRELDNKVVYQFGAEVLKTPDQIAVKFYEIPLVDGLIYAPYEGALFTFLGKQVANTFSIRTVPQAIEPISNRQKKAVQRVRDHIKHLLPDEREQRLFTSWLAYIVQNMGKPPKWAVLLQGVQGDGKSFFMHLMRAVLGAANTTTITGHALERDFNGWAAGYSFTCIEEVRVQGNERWKLLDKMKPIITNDTNDINEKGVKPYEALNTSAHILTSNYDDALPVDEGDRRYMILRSQWQKLSELVVFKSQNPHYYTNLYSAVADCAPALRHWLMNYELDQEFDAKGNAPTTVAKLDMIDEVRNPDVTELLSILQCDNHQFISNEFTSVGAMRDALGLQDRKHAKYVVRVLKDCGFTHIYDGFLFDNERHRVYSKVYTSNSGFLRPQLEGFFTKRVAKNGQFSNLDDTDL